MHRLKPRLRARHRSRKTRGQGLVEFALILPIMLTFFATALDLGRIAYAQVTVANAAREGAFQAAQTPTSFLSGQSCTSGNQTTNLVMCRTLLESTGSAVTVSPSDVAVTCNPAGCAAALGNTVSVSVTGHFRLLTPLLSTFFGGQDLTFNATSQTQLEVLPAAPTATPTPTPTATPTPSPTPTPAPTPTPIPGCVLPSAGFTYTTSPVSNQSPVTMTVADTSTSPGTGCAINTWTWTWGDGTTSTGQSPSPHIYGPPGSTTVYQVSLTVANGTGSNTSGTVSITVKK